MIRENDKIAMLGSLVSRDRDTCVSILETSVLEVNPSIINRSVERVV